MHVHRERKPSRPAGSRDHLRESRSCERRAALGQKDLPTVGPIPAQLPQCPDFIAAEGMS